MKVRRTLLMAVATVVLIAGWGAFGPGGCGGEPPGPGQPEPFSLIIPGTPEDAFELRSGMVTNSDGLVSFTSEKLGGVVEIYVLDNAGNPLQGMTVRWGSVTDAYFIFAEDPSGTLNPTLIVDETPAPQAAGKTKESSGALSADNYFSRVLRLFAHVFDPEPTRPYFRDVYFEGRPDSLCRLSADDVEILVMPYSEAFEDWWFRVADQGLSPLLALAHAANAPAGSFTLLSPVTDLLTLDRNDLLELTLVRHRVEFNRMDVTRATEIVYVRSYLPENAIYQFILPPIGVSASAIAGAICEAGTAPAPVYDDYADAIPAGGNGGGGGDEEDRDGDGTPDRLDGCPDDSNKTDPGECGCGEVEGPLPGAGAEPGTFSGPVYYGTFSHPLGAAIADFDGDGDNDLAVADNGAHELRISLNNGCGNFTIPQGYDTWDYPWYVAAGDVDGDGDQDLVSTHAGVCGGGMCGCGCPLAGVNVFLNYGDGTFAPFVNYALEYIEHWGTVVLGDLDGDGHIDLAVTTTGELAVLFNDGEGAFAEATMFAFSGEACRTRQAEAVAMADLDNDGDVDLVVAVSESCTMDGERYRIGEVAVLRNLGDGTFVAEETYSTGDKTIHVAAADFDNDGDIDIAALDGGDYYSGYQANTGELFILRNSGDGTFVNAGAYITPDVPVSMAVGDLDANGSSDIAVAAAGTCCSYEGAVTLFLNDGNADFTQQMELDAGRRFSFVVAGDLDGNGVDDLAVLTGTDSNVALWFNGDP